MILIKFERLKNSNVQMYVITILSQTIVIILYRIQKILIIELKTFYYYYFNNNK